MDRIVFALLAFACASALAAPPMFRVTQLPRPDGAVGNCWTGGINNAGQTTLACDGDGRAFLYTPGQPYIEITHPDGPAWISASSDINNAGAVAGNARLIGTSRSPGFVWDAANGMRMLPTLPYSVPYTTAYGMNDRGEVVGQSRIAFAARWSEATGVVELLRGNPNESIAWDIDNNGTAVGESYTGNVAFAFALGSDGQLQKRAGGARAISDNGLVTGYASTGRWFRAMVWTPSTGEINVIDSSPPTASGSSGSGINIHGQVVGSWSIRRDRRNVQKSNFYWDAQTGIVDLQTLLDPADPMTPLIEFFQGNPRINDHGQIAVTTVVGTDWRPLILTPLP